MKFKHLAIVAVGCALVVGAFTFAGDVLPTDDRSQTDEASAGDTSPSPSDGSVEGDDDARASPGSGGELEIEARDPGVGVPGKGASPMEMTTNLLGPAPDRLQRVQPGLSLEQAIRQHPAMAEEGINPDAPALPGLVDEHLSRLVQAHGILTEATDAASAGDEDARELVPYAAAQLATEAERAAPVFDATGELTKLRAESELRLHTEQDAVPPAEDLQTEVDRLYRTLGLEPLPVDTTVEDAHERARLLNAVTGVVQATEDAKQMGENVDTIHEDLERAEAALADGRLTDREARTLVDVANLVYDTTMTPLQTRLDALDTLYETASEVAPTLASPTAGHGEDPEVPGEVDDVEEQVEEAQNETENQAEELRNETENRLDEVRGEVDQAVQPVRDELANNFVDPLGAVVVLNETDETVSEDDQPEPVQVPGVGTVGSLFPRTPVLVVDRGGNTTYEGLPRSHAAEDVLQANEEPIAGEDDLGVDGGETIRGQTSDRGTQLGLLLEAFGEQIATVYDDTVNQAEDELAFDVALVLDTPVQVVVDLEGNDTYTGEVGAAHAAGGGTAAVYDSAGDDTYDVDRGIGLTQEDGLALVKDFEGDDTFRAERGIGSVIQPFNRTPDGVEFQDRFRYGLGGMGGLIAFDGNNTYEVGDAGIGVAFYNSTDLPDPMGTLPPLFCNPNTGECPVGGEGQSTSPPPLLPQTVPVALDLAGGAHGFQPTLIDDIPANTRVEKDDGGAAAVWSHQQTGVQDLFMTGLGNQTSSERLVLETTAAYRTYETGLAEASEGRFQVADHNVTLRDPTDWVMEDFIGCTGIPCLDETDLRMHNDIVVSMDGDDRYEPPYPLILVDAGDTSDTYVNASPEVPLFVSERDEPGEGAGETTAEQTSTAPMLALDTGGDDTYLGRTGSLNTSALLKELPRGVFTVDSGIGLQAERPSMPSSASVIVNDEGDNTYEGRIASTYMNISAPSTTFASIVYDGSGSDTLTGDTVAGLELEGASNSRDITGFGTQPGHQLVNLLLMGTDTEDEGERNTIQAGGGSLGSVGVVESRADTAVNALSRFTAGAAIAGPTDYTLGNHSIASVDWCNRAAQDVPDDVTTSPRTCPTVTNGVDDSTSEGGVTSPLVQALFVGSNGLDRYTVNTTQAMGHVTVNEDEVCPPAQSQGTIAAGDVDLPNTHIPKIVTRFADVAGPDDYTVLDREADIPDWRNDASWEPFSCPGTLDTTAPDDGRTQETVDDQTGEEIDGTDERPINDTDARNIDTLAIDNVGQYALGTAALGARGTVEDEVGNRLVQFEPPELCTGPYAIGDEDDAPGDGRPVVGFDVDRCADRDNRERLFSEDDAIRTDDRVTLTTRTDKTVPVSAFSAINPCDLGRTSGRSLELDVLESYAPTGNPLAHGTSGCWATLQLNLLNGSEAELASPEFEPLQADGTGWIDAFAGPVRCGYTDEGLQLRCSTDAMPVPLHVDGSDGRNLDRWMLPEGDYEYRMTFNGPIGALLGGESELAGRLTIDRQPLAEAGPLDEYPDSPTQTPRGLLAWLEDASTLAHDGDSDLLDGFTVRPVSQDDDGEPESLLVRAPLEMNRRPNLQPAVCVDGTPYRGDPATAETRWLADRGTWSTIYEAVEWEANTPAVEDPPEDCDDVDAGNELPDEGLHEVETALYHLDRVGEPERIELPEEATVDRVAVDSVEPLVDVGPLEMALGLSIQEPAISLDHVKTPEVDGFPTASEFSGDTVRVEWPIHVRSDSPIRELVIVNATGTDDVTDRIWEDNRLDENLEDDQVVLRTEDGSDDLCKRGPGCNVTLNVTDAGLEVRTLETPDGPVEIQTWHRNATLNLTLEPDEDTDLEQALEDSVRDSGRMVLQLPDLQVEDEAGNDASLDLSDITIDFRRPDDLALPCGAEGLGAVTDAGEHPIKTFPRAEDIGHVLVERLVDDEWKPQQVVPADDLDETNRACEAGADGDWERFTYNATDAAPGTTNLHRLRTVAIDEAGNRELSTEFFEFSILFDRQTPSLDVNTIASSPSSLEIGVASGEPIRLVEDETRLVGPDGTPIPPVGVPSEPVENVTLTFNGLEAGTTYTLNVTAEDRAGHANATTTNVTSAHTVRAALEDVPEIAGDRVTFEWSAGALQPSEGGDPQLRVTADALHGEDSCGDTRAIREFVAAPIDEPEPRTLTVPVSDCPSGNITLDLVLENGPVDDPLQRVHLDQTVLHDTEPPEPDVAVAGEVSETGWYTSAVSVSPTGTDDTAIAEAEIVTEQGSLDRLDLSQPGVHEVEVHVVDEAGREATGVLEVPIDLAGPSPQLIPLDPLPTERNLLTVQIDATDDASGLSSMRVLEADGTFGDWLPVVDGSQKGLEIRGLDRLVAEVRDRAGHVSQVSLGVSSLADAPDVSDARVEATSPSTVHVEASLDRELPLEVHAVEDGTILDRHETSAAEEHVLTLEGLPPLATVDIQAFAKLSNGEDAELEALSRTLTLPADQGPPTAVPDVAATPNDDGTVRVEWGAAADDAGVDRYLVQRLDGDTVTEQFSVEDTRLLDEPPAGATYTYAVQALDLASKSGPWTTSSPVAPSAGLQVVSYDISPEVATQGSPVTVTVTVRGPDAPQQATLDLGDERIPLTLQEGDDGLWTYGATLTPSATDSLSPHRITVHMDGERFPSEGAFPGPTVKVLETGEVSTDTSPVPAPGLGLLVAVAALAAAATRRWSA